MHAQLNHQEWEKENSLTSPADRDRINRWRPDQGAEQLSNDQVKFAMDTLNNIHFTSKFPKIERSYADPPIPLQTIGLLSFTPAKGATPNENGVYGFAKLRGNYSTEVEADQRAEYLIRNTDSYHQIYHTYVGRPFPLTTTSDYSAKTEEIDIRKEITSAISEEIKAKKRQEQNEVRSIKEREEALLAESKREEDDPYETYITLKVKKAQLTWNYLEHQKKIVEVRDIIKKTRRELAELDNSYPDFANNYFEKYMKARKDAGLKEDPNDPETKNNFIKYMVEDVTLDFDNEELTTERVNLT